MYNGMEMMDMLDEKELENITGGKTTKVQSRSGRFGKPKATTNVALAGVGMTNSGVKSQLMPCECPNCHAHFDADVSQSSVECPDCFTVIPFSG